MNTTMLKLTLMQPDPTDSLSSHSDWLDYCIKEFNEKCASSVVNRKKLTLVNTGDNYAIVQLDSELEPG